ncbi:DUF3317 family protein [Medicago truncatula]|uniref:DUF3317 family protein n=1 Tax=Medicago truncatula TaxID=3880 RepID=G7KWU5_MEDTR|nr:DUF3317 family protein [Medicago truncatula]
MNWVQRKVHLYNVTFGLFMLDWWERCSFSILYFTFSYIDFDSFRFLFLRSYLKMSFFNHVSYLYRDFVETEIHKLF